MIPVNDFHYRNIVAETNQIIRKKEKIIVNNNNLKRLVLAALFAALACVATMSIRIPTPGTNGYIHPGDAIVILSGVILGSVWGFLAGGISSALSDLIGGYFMYVPVTFVIKGLIALIAGLIISCILYPIIISIPNIRSVSPATK